MRTILIDSNHYCHRAKHTTGDLSTEEFATGIMFGFLMQILKDSERLESNKLVFFWDSQKSIRKDKYPFYKKKRIEKKKELTEEEQHLETLAYKQFTMLRRTVLPEIGFRNNFVQPGFEADDLMAKFVCYRDYLDCVMATADNDMWQCLELCDIYHPSLKKMITKESFMKEYGIIPGSWEQVKEIAGCGTDGVPGVYNVGNATAIKYLNGTLPKHHKTYKDITSEEGKKIAKRNRWLVSLPIPGTKLFPMRKDRFSVPAFIRICKKYEFDSFLKREWLDRWKTFLST